MMRRATLVWKALMRLREVERQDLGRQTVAALAACPAEGSFGAGGGRNWATAKELAWAVGVAAWVARPRPTCLTRSLVLWSLLRDAGIPVRMRLGARLSREDLLEAHAWVEVEGEPVAEPMDVEARFPRLRRGPVDGANRLDGPGGGRAGAVEAHGRSAGRAVTGDFI